MAAGWGAGPRYPRRANYGVTAGDVRLVSTAGFLGAAAAISPFLGTDDLDGRTAAGITTAGYVAGALVGDRIFARRLDHQHSDVNRIYLGIAAGATAAGAIPTLMDTENGAVVMSAWTLGAITGAAIMEGRIRAAHRRAGRVTGLAGTRSKMEPARTPRVEFNGKSALLAAAGATGQHTIVRVLF
jgi:hypothetical protein